MKHLSRDERKNVLKKLIHKGTTKQYILFFKQCHEADIAESLEELTIEERIQFFSKVNPELSAEILEELDITQQIEIISKFKISIAAKFIEEMEPDDAVDLLEELQETNEDQVEKIINALPKKEQQDLRSLLSYEDDSAGSIMTTSFLEIPENLTIAEAIKSIKNQNPPETELSFYIFIINTEQQLVGYTTMRDLLMADSALKIKNIRNNYPITIHVNDDREEVAKQFQKYNMSVLPVINDQDLIKGVITVDDIVDVVVEEANEDILKLTGTSVEDEKKIFSGTTIYHIIYRLPWLIITIGGGIVASYIITHYSTLFTSNLFPLALSLSFIPLLMGLGGNVGNQSSAIIVRRIATNTLKEKHRYIILKEILVGSGLGLILGLILLFYNIMIANHPPIFSYIVSISLLSNSIVATFFGTALPLLFNKLNIDPAIASAPFISTSLDIIGQIIYFLITLKMIHILLL